MQSEVGDWIVGPFVAVLGLIGLVLFGKANDGEMAIFGAALAAFAVVFVFGLMKRHFDASDRAKAAADGGKGGVNHG